MKNQFLKEKLLYICQKIYSLRVCKKALNWPKSSKKIFQFVMKNRLAHFYALEYGLFPQLIEEYKNYQKKIKKSLKKIKEYLGDKNFIIIKTFSSFPHLTSDVDVLVKKINNVQFPIVIRNKKMVRLHIQNKISWQGADAVSNSFAWKNTKKYNFGQFEFLVPNKKLDVILRTAHIPFEATPLRLGELLHIFRQIKEINWQEIRKEAVSMGWPKTFSRMERVLQSIHLSLFGSQLFNDVEIKKGVLRKINFPYQPSFKMLAGLVIEKRAWQKIDGARYVIRDRVKSWIKRKIY